MRGDSSLPYLTTPYLTSPHLPFPSLPFPSPQNEGGFFRRTTAAVLRNENTKHTIFEVAFDQVRLEPARVTTMCN